MKRILERLVWIIAILFVSFLTWQIRGCRNTHQTHPNLPDTIIVSNPDYLLNPSLVWRIGHKRLPPIWERAGYYQPWMADIWHILSVEFEDGGIRVTSLHEQDVRVQFFHDGSVYGTTDGVVVVQDRFSNPFHWTGILVGCQCSYSEQLAINPYIETGLTAWRVTGIIGATNEAVYGKIGVRLW
jgi:hypothetical protein